MRFALSRSSSSSSLFSHLVPSTYLYFSSSSFSSGSSRQATISHILLVSLARSRLFRSSSIRLIISSDFSRNLLISERNFALIATLQLLIYYLFIIRSYVFCSIFYMLLRIFFYILYCLYILYFIILLCTHIVL